MVEYVKGGWNVWDEYIGSGMKKSCLAYSPIYCVIFKSTLVFLHKKLWCRLRSACRVRTGLYLIP